MANAANDDTSKRRASAAARKLRDEIKATRKRYSEKIKKVKESKPLMMALNVGALSTTAVMSGAIQGLIPDEMVIMKTNIPIGIIRDVAGIGAGTVLGAGSAFAGIDVGVYAGAGIATTSAAGIARTMVRWGREYGVKMWNERNSTKRDDETEEQYQERLAEAA